MSLPGEDKVSADEARKTELLKKERQYDEEKRRRFLEEQEKEKQKEKEGEKEAAGKRPPKAPHEPGPSDEPPAKKQTIVSRISEKISRLRREPTTEELQERVTRAELFARIETARASTSKQRNKRWKENTKIFRGSSSSPTNTNALSATEFFGLPDPRDLFFGGAGPSKQSNKQPSKQSSHHINMSNMGFSMIPPEEFYGLSSSTGKRKKSQWMHVHDFYGF